MAFELRQFIQEAHAVVRPRHVPGQRHLAAAEQPDIRDSVMGGAKGARGDQGGAVAGEDGDAVDAGGFNGFGQGHRRQDGGEPARQYQLARPWGPSRRLWSQRPHGLPRGISLEREMMGFAVDLTILNDEPQPSHRITFSAWTGRDGGIVRPRAFGI
jgi:hypothetical protein